MTVIYRDDLGIIQIEAVRHFQVLEDSVYVTFLDETEETIEKNIEIIEVSA